MVLMGNDTKLGVLVGLVIVVVASVYFYGSSEEDGDLFVSPTSATGPPQVPDGPNESLETAQRPTPSFSAPPFENVSIPVANRQPSVGQGDAAAPGPRSAWSDRLANADRPSRRPAATVVVRSDTDAASENRRGIAGSPNRERGAPEPSNRPGDDAADRPWRFTGRPATPLRTRASDALTAATEENLTSRQPPTARRLAAPGPAAVAPVRPSGEARPSDLQRPANTTSGRDESNANSAGRERNATPQRRTTWPKHHRLNPRETLSDVAQDFYGSTSFVSLILRANPDIKDPRRIRENTEITLPNPDQAAPGSPPGRTRSVGSYLVRKDDSFYSIAKRVFGDGRRWHDIYELNKAIVKNNPKGLKPGMTIRLPSP